MKRTQIYLDQEQDRRLRDLAAQAGRPLTDLVRQALNEYLARWDPDYAPRVSDPPRLIPEDEWRSDFEAAVARMRAGVDPTWTAEEIEADIVAAVAEVRRERLARRRAVSG